MAAGTQCGHNGHRGAWQEEAVRETDVTRESSHLSALCKYSGLCSKGIFLNVTCTRRHRTNLQTQVVLGPRQEPEHMFNRLAEWKPRAANQVLSPIPLLQPTSKQSPGSCPFLSKSSHRLSSSCLKASNTMYKVKALKCKTLDACQRAQWGFLTPQTCSTHQTSNHPHHPRRPRGCCHDFSHL